MPKASKRPGGDLIGSAFSGPAPQTTKPPNDFIHNMLLHPDPRLAGEKVSEYAHDTFMKEKGAPLVLVEEQIENLKRRLAWHEVEAKRWGDLLQTVLRFVYSGVRTGSSTPSVSDSGETKTEVTSYDIFNGTIFFIGWAVLVAMGGANVYSSLMGSGVQVFIEDPWLAICLSALMPAGSIAIKLAVNGIVHSGRRKACVQILNVISCCLLIAWTALFAINYPGLAGSIDFAALAEPSPLGWIFVWVQTTCELVVSATVFLALDKILVKYFPPIIDESAEYTAVSAALRESRLEIEKLEDQLAEKKKELEPLLSDRVVFIREKEAEYVAARQRINNRSSL